MALELIMCGSANHSQTRGGAESSKPLDFLLGVGVARPSWVSGLAFFFLSWCEFAFLGKANPEPEKARGARATAKTKKGAETRATLTQGRKTI